MELRISTFDADVNRRLRLSSALGLQQEAGERHLESCGLSYPLLYDKRMVFIIARTRMVFTRSPELLETARLTTWSRGTKGTVFKRCYSWADEQGNRRLDAQTDFVLYDPEKQRMRRPADFDALYDGHLPERAGGCPEPEKLRMPEEMTFAGEREVYFSDIDYNRHMNNAVYADILCDFVPGGMGTRRVREMQINFLRQVAEGCRLKIYTAPTENGYFISAEASDARIFTGYLVFF